MKPGLLALVVGLGVAGWAQGQSYMVIQGAPLEFMTQDDLRIYQDALNRALEKSKDGATTRWENPETRAGGTINPVRSFSRDGAQCRELQLDNQARGRREKGRYAFCKDPQGEWKFTPGAGDRK